MEVYPVTVGIDRGAVGCYDLRRQWAKERRQSRRNQVFGDSIPPPVPRTGQTEKSAFAQRENSNVCKQTAKQPCRNDLTKMATETQLYVRKHHVCMHVCMQ